MTIPEGFNASQAIEKAVALEASQKQQETADKNQKLLKKRVDARVEKSVDELRAAAGWKRERNGRDAPVITLGREETAEHGLVSIVGVLGVRGMSTQVMLGIVFDEGHAPDIHLCQLGVTQEGNPVMGLLGDTYSSYQQYRGAGYSDRVPVEHLETLERVADTIMESAQDPVLNPSLVDAATVS